MHQRVGRLSQGDQEIGIAASGHRDQSAAEAGVGEDLLRKLPGRGGLMRDGVCVPNRLRSNATAAKDRQEHNKREHGFHECLVLWSARVSR